MGTSNLTVASRETGPKSDNTTKHDRELFEGQE